MINIQEVKNRGVLSEGRHFGMGFAFLKKVDKNKFNTVQPVSPCKDYLNDVVYGEHLNVSVNACGLSYTPEQPYKKSDKTFYMAIKIMPPKYGSVTGFDLKKETKELKDNHKNIESLINWIEDQIGIDNTTISPGTDEHYLVEGPSFWRESTPLISLYSLLIRMGREFDGKDPAKFLNEYKNSNEINLWNTAKGKLKLILDGHKVEQTFDPKIGGSIHGHGISYYKPEGLDIPKSVKFETTSIKKKRIGS